MTTTRSSGSSSPRSPIPAVDSLARAGMSWSVGLDANARRRVTKALGNRTPLSDVAWPAGRSLAPTTLSQLVSLGANAVVVGDSALTGGDVSPTPNAFAPVPTAAGGARLAVTSGAIERLVARVLDPAGDGLALLPELVSRLALRVMLDGPRYVVIAPPRDLDVAPDVAARTIEATAASTWSSPLTVEDALTDTSITPAPRGGLDDTVRGPQLGRHLLADLRQVTDDPAAVESRSSTTRPSGDAPGRAGAGRRPARGVLLVAGRPGHRGGDGRTGWSD